MHIGSNRLLPRDSTSTCVEHSPPLIHCPMSCTCPPLATLVHRYDAFFFDAYGVLVDQSGALPGALPLLAKLLDSHKPVYVLTNDASRLPNSVLTRFAQMGVTLTLGQIITAGEMIAPYFSAHELRGARCLVLGTADSHAYAAAAGGQVVAPSEPAGIVVVADDSGYTLQTLNDALNALLDTIAAGEPAHLIIANADRLYPYRTPAGQTRFAIASGSLGTMLADAVLTRASRPSNFHVAFLGKPETPMFDEAIRRAGTRNALMIGDQLGTDILGATHADLDSLLVGTGITDLNTLSRSDIQPTFTIPALADLLK